ncbi:MAG: SNF2-related protein, partial [Candidatus Thorarchaeota archaeon]
EVCEKLMLLPAWIKGPVRMNVPNVAPIRERQVQERIRSVEQRNARFFDEEVLKLDRWADDLKLGLERELKEIDKEIKEARRAAQTAVSLTDKLTAQKRLRQIEDKRNRKRRELYNGQDRIDEQRDELIRKIERQLKQRQEVEQMFMVHWRVV